MISDIDRNALQSALGDWMTAESYLAHWRGVTINKKPIDQESLQTAVMECASLRLSPAAGEVVVRPRWDKRRNVYLAKVMLTFRGMLTLMRRCPDIVDIEVNLVHKSDRYWLDGAAFHHEFDPFDSERTVSGPSDIKGGYARIIYKNGYVRYHYVPVRKILKARECATSSKEREDDSDPWSYWFAEMAMKTVVRDTFARSAVFVDVLTQAAMFRALELDDDALGNVPVPVSKRQSPSVSASAESAASERVIEEPSIDEDGLIPDDDELETQEKMPEWERAMLAASTVPELTTVMNTCLKMKMAKDERANVSALFKRRLAELRRNGKKGSSDDNAQRCDLPENGDVVSEVSAMR